MREFDLVDFYSGGGFFMHPILLCSVIAVGIAIERIWRLGTRRILPAALTSQVAGLVEAGSLAAAAGACRRSDSSIGRVVEAALSCAGRSREQIKVAVEEVGAREAQRLTRNLEGLATIANVATLLGLLGTISGMISIFGVIARQTSVNPVSLAGGISEALNTTAFGLTVAIPATVAYKMLTARAERLIGAMEEYAIRIVDAVHRVGAD